VDKDFILSGVHIGEHSFHVESILDELKERCVDPGHNFVTIRPPSHRFVPQEYYVKWAQYLADNQVYFVFLYTCQRTPSDRRSHLDPETVTKMKEVAGQYYLGDMLGETGSTFACFYKSYGDNNTPAFPGECFEDMETAHQRYLEYVGYWVNLDRELGIPGLMSVEATGLNKYNSEAGIEMPMLELMCGHPEILVSSLRGTARATNAKMWGTYLAHEWYGGMRHEDMLKRKRMSLAYKYAYLSGSQAFCLESGDESIGSFGYTLEKDSVVCQEYRNELENLTKFIKEDCRPVGGPKVKLAFVQGNHDAWGGWGSSTLWNQYDRPEWGHGEAEHSWRLLEELNAKRPWHDIANFGDEDRSAAPAYGMYDVIPAEAPAETYKQYDYLIFVGWNSMTDEIYDKLLAFVENGGKLLMTAAHLNYTSRRDGEKKYISNEKLEKLFGCTFTGETVSTNDGVKFWADSLSGLLYPGTKNRSCDPIYSAGYISLLKCVLTTGYAVGESQNDFANHSLDLPMVIENKVGKGVATLVTAENYPGHPALYPLYRAIVREMITQSARECELQVISSGALRYAVYEGGKMYLLNTDYDLPIFVKIKKGDQEQQLVLEPLELKSITI